MSSKTDLSNMSLAHLGIEEQIGNVDSDTSKEARTCRIFLPTVIKSALRDFDWPFARVTEPLGLLGTDPTSEWSYSYSYPKDCVAFRKISSGVRQDSQSSKIPHSVNNTSGGRVIYTDQSQAVGVFTTYVSSTALWPVDFFMSVSLLLAYNIEPALTSNNGSGLGKKAYERYWASISNAKANSAMEEQRDRELESEFIRGRE